MNSKSIKTIAKFNALHLAATQLMHQCSAQDTLGDIEGIPPEILDEMEVEISKIVKSLQARAERLNNKFTTELPNLVEESQSFF